jgi:hypothetical protein
MIAEEELQFKVQAHFSYMLLPAGEDCVPEEVVLPPDYGVPSVCSPHCGCLLHLLLQANRFHCEYFLN